MTGPSTPEWFVVIQSIGIISSLIFAASTLWMAMRSQRVSNYLKLVEYHRDIWKMTLANPSLADLFESSQSRVGIVEERYLSFDQRQFLSFLCLHLSCAYELQKVYSVVRVEGLKADIAEFFSSPLIRDFWEKNKRFHNSDFVSFVDTILK